MNGKNWVFVLIWILSFFLAGCGGREDAAVQKEDVISDYYTMEIIPLEAGIKSSLRPWIAGREIYYAGQEGKVCTSSRFNIDSRETVKTEFSVDRLESLCNFVVDSDGSTYYLLSLEWEPAEKVPEGSDMKLNLYLMKRSAEGEEVFFRKIEDEKVQYTFNMEIDGEGRICLLYDKLHAYDREDGRYLGEEERVMDREKEVEFYYQKLALEKYGVIGEQVTEVVCLEDGRIEASVRNWETGSFELVLLAPSSVPFREGKTEIVLGVLQRNSLMRNDVVDFNKGREDIYVTIREYQPSGSPRTAEEAASALMGDILAGNGPDLIAFPPGEELEMLAVQGVMEDLESYVEEGRVINREDYLPAAWELGRQGETLYGIPMRFALQTLAGKASLLGGRDGWTAGDFMAFVRSHPDSLPIDGCSKSWILSLCISFQAEEYLDREAGVSRFDVPEFREIMEFADTFAPDDSPASAADEWKYRDGRVLLMEADLYDAESCLGVYQAFGREEISFPGYPSGDGAGGHLISRCNVMYGITSCSAHKQEAWEFVERAVQRDAENERVLGFPARRADLEAYLDREFERLGLEAGAGTPGTAEAGNGDLRRSKEMKEAVFTLAGQAVTEAGWESEAAEILMEETAPYFNGRKSLDKTIDVIQNRMNLLLGE